MPRRKTFVNPLVGIDGNPFFIPVVKPQLAPDQQAINMAASLKRRMGAPITMELIETCLKEQVEWEQATTATAIKAFLRQPVLVSDGATLEDAGHAWDIMKAIKRIKDEDGKQILRFDVEDAAWLDGKLKRHGVTVFGNDVAVLMHELETRGLPEQEPDEPAEEDTNGS